MNDEDVDRILRQDGQRWRASLEAPPELDATWFTDSQPRSVRLKSVMSAMGASAALVVVVIVLLQTAGIWSNGVPGTGPSGSPSSTFVAVNPTQGQPSQSALAPWPSSDATPSGPAPDPFVDDGDAVAATGRVFETYDGTPAMCSELAIIGSGLVCVANVRVKLSGVDARELPGSDWTGTWVSRYVTVRGAWRTGEIVVAGWEEAQNPSAAPPPPVPCDEPLGGWPDEENDEDRLRAAEELDSFVSSRPYRFAGIWSALVASGSTFVPVVGTVDDVPPTEAELSAIYPYNLCVTQVTYSIQELTDRAGRISGLDDEWSVTIDPPNNRLIVRITVNDRDTAAALEPYRDMIDIETLVVPIT